MGRGINNKWSEVGFFSLNRVSGLHVDKALFRVYIVSYCPCSVRAFASMLEFSDAVLRLGPTLGIQSVHNNQFLIFILYLFFWVHIRMLCRLDQETGSYVHLFVIRRSSCVTNGYGFPIHVRSMHTLNNFQAFELQHRLDDKYKTRFF